MAFTCTTAFSRVSSPSARDFAVAVLTMEELPECPVCLQSYDGACTIPRVLTCGHTACETCLLKIPQKFPQTIRCPACTVLVKYPPQGPSFLPKNIDLLRLVEPSSSKSRENPKNSHHVPEFDFIPHSWSDEFYSFWKQFILPNDAVLVEEKSKEESGFRLGCLKERESQRVSLVKVGSLFSSGGDDDAVFKYSYFARVMNCLSGMRAEERDELGLILKAASKEIKFCRVLGLWGDMEDGFLCLVCERLNQIEKLGLFRDGDGFSENGLPSFAVMGMEICEALIGLNKQGLNTGCLALTCFNFDSFGHLYVDLNDVLAVGRRVAKSVAKVGSVGGKICDKDVKAFLSDLLASNVFLSPEVLYDLFKKEGIRVERVESSVGYGSDVWSLACILLSILFGKEFTNELVDYIRGVNKKASEDNSLDCLRMHMAWTEKVIYLLENKFGSEFVSLQKKFCQCLNFDPGSRPLLTNVWKCIRELIVKPEIDKMIRMDEMVSLENQGHCLVLGKLCWLPKGILEIAERDDSLGAENRDGADIDQGGEATVVKDLVEGLSDGNVKFKEMQGHRDCVTGLAVGGTDVKQCP